MMKKLYLIIFLLFPVLMEGAIYTLKIEGPIETITEEYISDSFQKIKKENDAQLVIIMIDTPGGLFTAMRSVIKEILDSPVPVAVYVSPSGASAASAGFLITISADISAMAPGTNMGAATPVAITGAKIEETMKKKVTNDVAAYVKSLAKSRNRNIELSEKAVRESASYTAEECLKKKLAEYIAEDIEDLVRQLEGKEIRMVNGKTLVLKLKEKKIIALTSLETYDKSTRKRCIRKKCTI